MIVGHAELSDYEIERFGDAAPFIRNALIKVVKEAHDAAQRVHAEQEWEDRDAYSDALRVALNRGLLRELSDVPGVIATKPAGQRTRFDLPVIQQTGVVLYWWRVPGDGTAAVNHARLRKTSLLQEHLLRFVPCAPDPQLTIDHVDLTDAELEQQRLEEEQFHAEMSHANGRTVMLWISASPDGLFDFGWGDAALADAKTGRLEWTDGPHSIKDYDLVSVDSTLKLLDAKYTPVDRFDTDTATESGFDLSLRAPTEEVTSEKRPTDDAQGTGSEDR